jgi:tRNA (guanine37-N1)-methyltransferase
MKFDIITLFPQMFEGPLSESIIKRAKEKRIIDIELHQLRDYSEDKHHNVDDTPCGGGKGMVLRVDVIDKAISAVKERNQGSKTRTILLTPNGRTYNQDIAKELIKYDISHYCVVITKVLMREFIILLMSPYQSVIMF